MNGALLLYPELACLSTIISKKIKFFSDLRYSPKKRAAALPQPLEHGAFSVPSLPVLFHHLFEQDGRGRRSVGDGVGTGGDGGRDALTADERVK